VNESCYVYYLTQRPPMPGAQPRKGLLEMKEFEDRERAPYRAWGMAVYDRKLTDAEVQDYELTPAE